MEKIMPYILLLLSSAVISAIVTGLMNLRINRKKSYIDTVTAERIKWLDKLRTNISSFVSYSIGCTLASGKILRSSIEISDHCEKKIKLLEISTFIKLQLNPNDPNDLEVSKSIDSIMILVENHTSDLSLIKDKLSKLQDVTRKMLKAEWEKVKEESIRGQLQKDEDINSLRECGYLLRIAKFLVPKLVYISQKDPDRNRHIILLTSSLASFIKYVIQLTIGILGFGMLCLLIPPLIDGTLGSLTFYAYFSSLGRFYFMFPLIPLLFQLATTQKISTKLTSALGEKSITVRSRFLVFMTYIFTALSLLYAILTNRI